MSGLVTIEDIQKKHEKLYGDVLRDHSSLVADEAKLGTFMKEVDQLLAEMKAATVTSVEEYNWLNDVAIKWQIVFSSILNIPITIRIAPPQMLKPSPVVRVLSKDELKARVEEKALSLSSFRKAEWLLREVERLRNIPSPDEEQAKVEDWHSAIVLLASDILDGKIDFVFQIRSKSYTDFVEPAWLQEVKKVRAYFIWKDGYSSGNAAEDYYQACKRIRDLFVDPRVKASLRDFEEPKVYLETCYLTDGKINKTKPGAKNLIARKALRIYEMTGQADAVKNWLRAEQYVQLFYENIIPAVTKKDPGKTRQVLKAFQFSSEFGDHDLVVGFFEVAVAMYFLDPQIIQEIWDKEPRLANI